MAPASRHGISGRSIKIVTWKGNFLRNPLSKAQNPTESQAPKGIKNDKSAMAAIKGQCWKIVKLATHPRNKKAHEVEKALRNSIEASCALSIVF